MGRTVEDSDSVSYLVLVKILRLVRLARLVRLLRLKCFAELKVMVEGVLSGIRVLIWAIVLLGLCIFLLSVMFRMILGANRMEFSTLMRSMLTLFRCVTDGCTAFDGTPLQNYLHNMYGGI